MTNKEMNQMEKRYEKRRKPPQEKTEREERKLERKQVVAFKEQPSEIIEPQTYTGDQRTLSSVEDDWRSISSSSDDGHGDSVAVGKLDAVLAKDELRFLDTILAPWNKGNDYESDTDYNTNTGDEEEYDDDDVDFDEEEEDGGGETDVSAADSRRVITSPNARNLKFSEKAVMEWASGFGWNSIQDNHKQDERDMRILSSGDERSAASSHSSDSYYTEDHQTDTDYGFTTEDENEETSSWYDDDDDDEASASSFSDDSGDLNDNVLDLADEWTVESKNWVRRNTNHPKSVTDAASDAKQSKQTSFEEHYWKYHQGRGSYRNHGVKKPSLKATKKEDITLARSESSSKISRVSRTSGTFSKGRRVERSRKRR